MSLIMLASMLLRRTRFAPISLAMLLLLVSPIAIADNYEEIEAAEFNSWFDLASCNSLYGKYVWIERALAGSKHQLREWELKMRVQLVELHGQYDDRCISKHRTWNIECRSLQHAIRVVHSALFDDDVIKVDIRIHRGTLSHRRRRIHSRYQERCILPEFTEEDE